MGGSKCGEAIGGNNGTESNDQRNGIRIEAVACAYRWNKIPNRGGRTFVNGTGYDIAFAKSIPITIPAGVSWDSAGNEQGEVSLVTDCSSLLLNGATITEPTTLNISRSDTFVARLRSRGGFASARIVVNGVYKVHESTNDVYKDYNLWDYIPEEAVSATVKVGWWLVPTGGTGGEVWITTT